MFTLPQLIDEDLKELDGALADLLTNSDANCALLLDKGGFVITSQGRTDDFDTTTVGALAAASFAANMEIANQVGEATFTNIYQQGNSLSILVSNVDMHCLIVVVFKAQTGVGAVKYYAAETIRRTAAQLKRAGERNPDGGFDLATLNIVDTDEFFRKKD